MTTRQRTEAFVLHRAELGEADRLVTLLADRLGKVKAVAAGARASRRRFGGCLELFCHLDVVLADRGGGRLARLEEAALLDPHGPIKGDLVSIAHASYATELIEAFLREGEPAPESFTLLKAILTRCDAGPLSALELRRLELEVLAGAGLAPNFSGCVQCGGGASTRWALDPERGGILCERCLAAAPQAEPILPAVLELLRRLAGPLPAGPIAPAVMAATRRILAAQIDRHLSGPLKAREFLYQLSNPRGE